MGRPPETRLYLRKLQHLQRQTGQHMQHETPAHPGNYRRIDTLGPLLGVQEVVGSNPASPTKPSEKSGGFLMRPAGNPV
jgi:hypothetical protein